MRLGVSVGPDGNDRCCFCPVARILTEVPPTSTTSTFLTADPFATRARSCFTVQRLARSDVVLTALARSLEDDGFGSDHTHQVIPRIDERLGALLLQLERQRMDV